MLLKTNLSEEMYFDWICKWNYICYQYFTFLFIISDCLQPTRWCIQVPEAGDGTSLPSTGTHRRNLPSVGPDAIIPVMDYVYSTWISNSIFKVHQCLCSCRQSGQTTTWEGWHNRFNSNIVTREFVPFYHLVTELYAESTDIPIQLKLISEGKLKRYQRKRSRQIQGQVVPLVSCSGSAPLCMNQQHNK